LWRGVGESPLSSGMSGAGEPRDSLLDGTGGVPPKVDSIGILAALQTSKPPPCAEPPALEPLPARISVTPQTSKPPLYTQPVRPAAEVSAPDRIWDAESVQSDDAPPVQPNASSHMTLETIFRKYADGLSPVGPVATGAPALFPSPCAPLPEPPSEPGGVGRSALAEAVVAAAAAAAGLHSGDEEDEEPPASDDGSGIRSPRSGPRDAASTPSILVDSPEARFACRAKWQRLGRRVTFREGNCTYDVQPYSEVYGVHPRFFDFDAEGNKVEAGTIDDVISSFAGGLWAWFQPQYEVLTH